MQESKFYNDAGWIKNPDTAHDVANIEDKGHGTLKAKLENAQKEADEYEKIKSEQFELGEKIFSELEKSVASNTVFNLLDDKPNEEVGPLKIWKLENNNGKYTMTVQIDDKKSVHGNHPLFQIDINFHDTGKEIHVFTAPYGPDNYYAVQATDLLVEKLAKQISEYRLYNSQSNK